MRRLNLRFAAGLFFVLTLAGVGIFFLHRFQHDRIARDMLWQVQHYRDEGNVDEAIRHAHRYLEFRPDDFDTIIELANWLEGKAEGRRQLVGVVNQLERALRLHPNRSDLRRRIVALDMKLGQTGECLDHLDRLLQETPDDAELNAWLGNCRVWTGKHAEAAQAYQKALKCDPKRLATYLDYSYLLNRHLHRTDDARKLLEEAVKVNPESADARIALARFLRLTHHSAEAMAAAKEAVRIAPDSITVLTTASDIFQKEGKYRQAREYLQKACELEPNNGRLVTSLAWLMLYEGKGEEAITRLRAALAEKPDDVDVLTLLGDILALEGRIDQLEAVVNDLEKLRKSAPQRAWNVDYMRARLTIRKGDYVAAADLLEKLRSQSSRSASHSKQANYLLATCYEQLRQRDNELSAYRRIIEVDATAGFFRLEYARALARHGELDEAIAQFRSAIQRPDLPPRTVIDVTAEFADRCRRAGDKTIRDFERGFEALRGDDAAVNAVLAKVELLRLRGRQRDALATANVYLAKHPAHPAMHALKARIVEASQGPEAATAVLVEAESRVGDDADLRLAKLRLLASRMQPGHTEPLFVVASKLDSFSPEDRSRIQIDLISACTQIGDHAATGRALEIARAARPDQLMVRGLMLSRALGTNDPSSIQQLLTEVAAVEGANGWYARLFAVEQAIHQRQPAIARQHLGELSKLRPGEPLVEFYTGTLDEMEDRPSAKEHYVAALDHGLLDLPIEEFLERLGKLDPSERKLRVFIEECNLVERLRLDLDRGILRAVLPMVPASTRSAIGDRLLKANPDASAPQLYWLAGQFQKQHLARAAQECLARAAKAAPASDELWAGRVAQIAARGDAAAMHELVNEARRAMPPTDLALHFGKHLEAAGMVADAVKLAQDAAVREPTDARLHRRLAHLFQITGRVGDARRELQVLVTLPKQSADELAWARRQLAANFAIAPSLEAYKTSMQLLEANRVDGKLSDDDTRTLALVYAAQRGRMIEQQSGRQRAIALLEQLEQRSPTADDLILQSRLYRAEENVAGVRRVHERLLRDFAQSLPALHYLARTALQGDSLAEASPFINQLLIRDPKSFETVSLAATRLALANDIAGAKALLDAYVAAVEGPAKAVRMLRAGHWCSEFLQQYPMGEQPALAASIRELGIAMYRPALGRDPHALLQLCKLYAKHDRTDLALDLLQTDSVTRQFGTEAQAAASVIALRFGKPTPQQVTAVDRRLNELLRSQPNSASLALVRADFLDYVKKHDEAAELYSRVLTRDPESLVARNNLAWILSFDPKKIGDAVRLIQEAIDRHGPLDDLLETRGRILFAAGERDAGLRDVNEALAGSPSASGYFSLALMYRQAGQTEAADRALARAKRFGLTPADVHPLDAGAYRELVRN